MRPSNLIKSGEVAVQRAAGEGGGSSEALAVLKRGDCVGEAVLIGAEDSAIRTAKRKTRIVAKSDAVVLMLTPAALAGLSTLQEWQQALGLHVAASAHAGVDCVTVERLTASGNASVLASLGNTSSKKGAGQSKGGPQSKGKKAPSKGGSLATPKGAAKGDKPAKGSTTPKSGSAGAGAGSYNSSPKKAGSSGKGGAAKTSKAPGSNGDAAAAAGGAVALS